MVFQRNRNSGVTQNAQGLTMQKPPRDISDIPDLLPRPPPHTLEISVHEAMKKGIKILKSFPEDPLGRISIWELHRV